MPGSTPEQDAYVKSLFGLDVSAPSGGSGGAPGGAPGGATAGEPSGGGPPPGFVQPPDGVLPRAGDGAIYWHPNTAIQTTGGPSTTPAGSKWITDFLAFYNLAPAPDPAKAIFNGAVTTLNDVAQLAGAQAQLAGFAASSSDVLTAAQASLALQNKAGADGDKLSNSKTVISEADIAALAQQPMLDLLLELEAIRQNHQLDAIAGRAKDHRLRLAILSVKHDLSDEWSKLMKEASDPDQTEIRKHVYGSIVAGDTGDGAAPPVDAPEDSKSSRHLTSTEHAYLKTVFHDSLDYTKMTITKGSVKSAGSTARTTGNTINFPSSYFQPGTLELKPEWSATLVHESTHVWQYQHHGWGYAPAALWAQLKAFVTTGDRDNAYHWEKLAAKHASWDKFNPEQQAQLVEDYNIALRNMLANKPSLKDSQTLSLVAPYIAIVMAGPKS